MSNIEYNDNETEVLNVESIPYNEKSLKIGLKKEFLRNYNDKELILSAAPHLYKEQYSYYDNEVKKEWNRFFFLNHH